MKLIASIIVSLVCIAATANAQTSTFLLEARQIVREFHFDDFKQVLFGVLEGSLGHEVDLAEKCINEGEETMKDLEEAVQDISEGTEESVREGIQLLGQVFQETTQDLQDCELAEEDLDRLVDMTDILSHPLTFLYNAGKNIIVNHVEIFNEIDDAIDEWEAAPPKYYEFGFSIGSAMKLILEGADRFEEESISLTDIK